MALGLIFSGAMLQGLMDVDGGGSILPFVHGSPSTCWWDDASFALGQHKALVAVSERLLPTERLFFHDDLCVLCGPPRVADVHIALQQALWEHSRIQSSSLRQDPALESGRRGSQRVGCTHSSSSAGRPGRNAEILNSLLLSKG